jgi:DNA-binding NarL/FixJ family response regulator
LARYDEDIRIVTALQAGAFGYVLKDIDQTDFLRIIRATARGEHILSPLIPTGFVHNVPGTVRPTHKNHTALLLSLTERERELLACAAAGRSNKEIAEQLCVSIDTVKTHLHHTYQKLSVGGRVEAILTYLRAQ